jgi:hypothetical protein
MPTAIANRLRNAILPPLRGMKLLIYTVIENRRPWACHLFVSELSFSVPALYELLKTAQL